MGNRAWMRYTAKERLDYEMQIRKLKMCIPICIFLSFVIGFLLGLVY